MDPAFSKSVILDSYGNSVAVTPLEYDKTYKMLCLSRKNSASIEKRIENDPDYRNFDQGTRRDTLDNYLEFLCSEMANKKINFFNDASLSAFLRGTDGNPFTYFTITKEWLPKLPGGLIKTPSRFYWIVKIISDTNSTRTSENTIDKIVDFFEKNLLGFIRDLRGFNLASNWVEAYLTDPNYVDPSKRGPISLVSKVCRYVEAWLIGKNNAKAIYTAYDSFVVALLPFYFALYHKRIMANKKGSLADWKRYFTKLGPKSTSLALRSEISYCDFLDLFEQIKAASHTGLNNFALDHLIWYGYKSDAIRTAASPYLAYRILHDDGLI